MEFPLIVYLIIYLVIALVVFVFSFFHLYHAFRFGMHTGAAYAMSAAYVLVVLLILGGTWLSVRTVDWSQTITIELPSIGVERAP